MIASRVPPTLFGWSVVLRNCIGSLSPSLSLSRSLGGHVWNHLISQKTGQSDEEDKCNARSAKSGERRGEGEENIENNVQACNLKSSAQKVIQHRLRDLNLEAQIVPKCLPRRTLDNPWELEGLCWEIWGLLGRSLEVLGSSVELLGSSLGALGNDFGALGDDFGSILG